MASMNVTSIKLREPTDILLGALIYTSTTFIASNALLIIVIIIIGIRGFNISKRNELIFIAAFVAIALINIIFHIDNFDPQIHLSSLAVPFVLAMALTAPKLNQRSLKVFVTLCCLEVLIGAYEYSIGQVAIFPNQVNATGQEISINSLYLYDLRVFGLSSNSSLLAEKIFLSSIIFASIPSMFKNKKTIITILIAGLILSFNRTAILATISFCAVIAISKLYNSRPKYIIFFTLIISISFSLLFLNLDSIITQFTRGNPSELSHSELSRLYFWVQALDLIVSNPLFGNGSLTFRIPDPITGLPQHAHNSLVMILATHGILTSLFLFAYIIIKAKNTQIFVLIAFFIFSMTQYFIFWNLSVPDLIFFWLLGRDTSRYSHPPLPLRRCQLVSMRRVNTLEAI